MNTRSSHGRHLTNSLAASMVFLATVASTGAAEVFTFDDLPSGSFGLVAPIYDGEYWNNFDYADGTVPPYSNSGYGAGVVSPNNVVLNDQGHVAQMSSPGYFDLVSAYLTGAWNDGLNVEVKGFVGITLLYDNTYTVNATGPTLVNFNYVGISRVEFSSFGGTPHPGYGLYGSGEQFVMDNLTIEPMPEPSSALVLGGCLLLSLLERNRRMDKTRKRQ